MKRAAPFAMHLEIAPLSEAAAIAFHVLGPPQSIREPGELAEVRYLVARALAAVAPVLRQEGDAYVPLSGPEITAALYQGPDVADLNGLYMRRCHLLLAMESLRGVGFGELYRRAQHGRPAQPRSPDERGSGLAPVELARDPAEDG